MKCRKDNCETKADLNYDFCWYHANYQEPKGEADIPPIIESALDKQVGGGHYKDMAIQPLEFTHKNNLNFCQGNIVKYASRYKSKNGIEDLKKVKHYAELLAKLEYGVDI